MPACCNYTSNIYNLYILICRQYRPRAGFFTRVACDPWVTARAAISDLQAAWISQIHGFQAAGSVNQKWAPPAARFAAPILPPCPSTIDLQIARPNPVPWACPPPEAR